MRDIGKDFDRGKTIIDIGAFCLMPNHFHILIREKIQGGVSLYMKKLLTAYSMYFNKKYGRTGRLFENTFKSSHAGNDRYLKYLYAYIHLNPAKLADKNWRIKKGNSAKILRSVLDYPFSSLQEYLNLEKELFSKNILNPNAFPKYFSKSKDHLNELIDWLDTTP